MTFYVTVAGGGVGPITLDGGTNAPPSNVYARVLAGGVSTIHQDGSGIKMGVGASTFFGIAATENGSVIFGEGQYLRRFSPQDGIVTTIGNWTGGFGVVPGNGFSAQFPPSIQSIGILDDTTIIFTADNTVWMGKGNFTSPTALSAGNFNYYLIGGGPANEPGADLGQGSATRFRNPSALVVDQETRTVYFAEQGNQRIIKANSISLVDNNSSAWIFQHVSGTGVSGYAEGGPSVAQYNLPDGIALGDDNALYVSDTGNDRLRRISLATSNTSTVAGDGTNGFVDGTPGTVTSLRSIVYDGAGSFYFYDLYRLRVFRNGRLYTIATDTPGGLSDGYLDGAGQQSPSRLAVNRSTGTIYAMTTSAHGSVKLVAYEAVVP